VGGDELAPVAAPQDRTHLRVRVDAVHARAALCVPEADAPERVCVRERERDRERARLSKYDESEGLPVRSTASAGEQTRLVRAPG
jgi:hypothetical protein